MASSKRTQFFNGNKGEVWVAGTLIGTVSKGKVTKKYNYEEIPSPTGNGTTRVPTHEIIEISMTFRLTGEEREIDMFNLNEDITVIMANTNIAETSRSRIKCDGVTFDEETLINFEKHKVEEIELTGQAETVDYLE